MDAREEGRAGSGTAEDIDRHHFSFPCSATTMPKPISFRARPEYSQSYRQVRRSFEMTLLPTMVCRLPVTSDRTSVVLGKRWSVRGDLVGCRYIKKKKKT